MFKTDRCILARHVHLQKHIEHNMGIIAFWGIQYHVYSQTNIWKKSLPCTSTLAPLGPLALVAVLIKSMLIRMDHVFNITLTLLLIDIQKMKTGDTLRVVSVVSMKSWATEYLHWYDGHRSTFILNMYMLQEHGFWNIDAPNISISFNSVAGFNCFISNYIHK